MLGKFQGSMVKAARPRLPMPALTFMTHHSIGLYLTTEDLPHPDNRVVGGAWRMTVHWKPNNLVLHQQLARRVARVVRRAGYPLIFTERRGTPVRTVAARPEAGR